jgi:hypothetical protein
VNTMRVQIAAVAGACAATAGIAVGAMALNNQAGGFNAEPAAPSVTIQTTQVAPTTPEVPEAKPQITGPAPLPSEDQGLPG